MVNTFYKQNREELYATLPNGTVLVTHSGKEVIKTADEFYAFFANRNFVYLTGVDFKEFILAAVKVNDKVIETSMSGVLDLCYVFKLVVDGFDNSPLP